ncbi:MAG: beta-galactosidase [Lautropia sp.]
MHRRARSRLATRLATRIAGRLLPALAIALAASASAAVELADPGRPGDLPTPGTVGTMRGADGAPAPPPGYGVILAGVVARDADADADGFRGFDFGPGAEPSIELRPRVDPVWNLGGAKSLKLHVQNPMPWPLTVDLTVRDIDDRRLHARVGLRPGPPVTLTIPLEETHPIRWGMRAGPPMPFLHENERLHVALDVTGEIDPRLTTAVRLAIPQPDAVQTLRVGKVFSETSRYDERLAYAGIVDAFGQYTRSDWPGKWSDTPPRRSKAQALATSAPPARPAGTGAAPPPAALASIPAGSLNATGFFRTERAADASGAARWWLVTPDGRPFFSLGVNAVQIAQSETFVEGREFMFSNLPPRDGPLARFHGWRDSFEVVGREAGAQRERGFGRGASFDFYRANLFRRDGTGYVTRWRERTGARLRDWGFNTVGAWSDEDFARASDLPYTAIVHIDGDFARLSDGHDWWAGIADPFDPRFERAVATRLEATARRLRHDPDLIGWFVDNELAWGGDGDRRFALVRAVLASDGQAEDGHAKRAFVEWLRARYRTPGALALAWRMQVTDWSALLAPIPPHRMPDPTRASVARDFSSLLSLHAQRWFEIVATHLKAADPNHLFLGTRFAGLTPEALAACARWCDVVSFNRYVPDLATGFDGAGFRRLAKPAMLTEFHFGSSDRGPFWPGVQPVADDAQRGPAYARLLASVLANPDFVGAHWFQFLDQPVTGRWIDGENGHLGLVAITDEPWAPFVSDVTTANRDTLAALAGLFRAPRGARPRAR